jgi:hypothetical protein
MSQNPEPPATRREDGVPVGEGDDHVSDSLKRYLEKRREKTLWHQFEEASPKEREGMVEWCEWWESSDGKDIAVRHRQAPKPWPGRPKYLDSGKVQLHGFGGIPSKDAYLMLKSVKWEKHIIHTKIWIKMRDSFHDSKEWKQFRLQWLQAHPACVRCGRTDGVFQVHHAGHYNLDRTVIEEGFLEGLKHPERFETLCSGCHYKEHEFIISEESVLKEAPGRGSKKVKCDNWIQVIGRTCYKTTGSVEIANDAWERQGRNQFLFRMKNRKYFLVTQTRRLGEQSALTPLTQDEAIKAWEELSEHNVTFEEAFPGVTVEDA